LGRFISDKRNLCATLRQKKPGALKWHFQSITLGSNAIFKKNLTEMTVGM
jgi:hypothetical protein